MRHLVLEAIRAIHSKEADSGRYLPVKRHLHELLGPSRGAQFGVSDKVISKRYNLDSFDYDMLTDEELLAIFITFCRREWTQR